MTALECLKILRKGFLVLIVWNLLITGCLLAQCNNRQADKLNQQICNLEAIPDEAPQFELVEVE